MYKLPALTAITLYFKYKGVRVRLHELIDQVGGLRLLTDPRQAGRRLQSVYTTDLANPGRYLAGGELVLTSGLWFTERPDSCVAFARALSDARSTALGFGIGLIDAVPAELIAACESLRLPLLEVGADVAFQTITEAVMGDEAARQVRILTDSRSRSHRLQRAAVEGGVDSLLRTLASELNAECWLLSPVGHVSAGTSPLALDSAVLIATASIAQPKRTRWSVKLVEGSDATVLAVPEPGRRWKQLLVCDAPLAKLTLEQREHLEEAAGVIAMIDIPTAWRGAPGTAIQHLADALGRAGNVPGEASALGRVAGIPAGAAVRVVLARSSNIELAELILGDDGGRLEWVPGLARLGDDSFRLLLSSGVDDGCRETLQEHLRVLAPLAADAPVFVGVSEPAFGGAGLSRALEQARASLEAAISRETPFAPVFSDDLKTARSLLEGVPSVVRADYRQRILGDVLAYDLTHGAELEETLAAFLAHSASYKACAAALHVHVNTVRYRIAHIQRLTGLSVTNVPDQATLYLALEAGAVGLS